MEGIEELSVATGARVEYLPPYSPDFNPIEIRDILPDNVLDILETHFLRYM
ncbi:MAG: hypothetical protein GDA48_07180 [Hormoscilla sp. GM102CHS1]|nr:hypothetical protein [Hormoscilla sp. GM102CHS1]